jgi:hypothetical protein
MMPPQLFYFGFGIFDVLLRNRIVFSLLHFIGLCTRILPGHVVVTGAGAGNQLDLEADGFGHGICPLQLNFAMVGCFGAETSVEAVNVKKAPFLARVTAVPERTAFQP